MTVTKMKSEMSATEYFDWILFYKERERKQDANSGNLLAMNPEDILGKFNG